MRYSEGGQVAAENIDELIARYGKAKHPERAAIHQRPNDASDEIVSAVGKVSEAMEVVENARGHLYEFHRLSGTADLSLRQAVSELRSAGQRELADQIEQLLVGRDVIGDMWTFQLVEAYDAQYWSVFRAADEYLRTALSGGVPHVYEAEMKQREQAAD
jgi:hypothetical protein